MDFSERLPEHQINFVNNAVPISGMNHAPGLRDTPCNHELLRSEGQKLLHGSRDDAPNFSTPHFTIPSRRQSFTSSLGSSHEREMQRDPPCPNQYLAQGQATVNGDVSNLSTFIRKLRQRERSDRGMWKTKPGVYFGKRTLQSMDDASLPPAKQFISDERMAARMSKLSLTLDNEMTDVEVRWRLANDEAERQLAMEERLSDSDSDIDLDYNYRRAGAGSRRIKVSQALQSALAQREQLLPESIVNSISKPCKQLILWKAPMSYIDDVINTPANQKTPDMLRASDNTSSSVEMNDPCEQTAINRDGFEQIRETFDWSKSIPIGLFDSLDDEMDL